MKIVGEFQRNWDIDLDYGYDGESRVLDLLSGASKIEVKNDTMAHRTGNIAVEFRCYGKPSGISTTEADYWAFVLLGGEIVYFIEVNRLKKLAKLQYKESGSIKGGDYHMSEMILIPIKNLTNKLCHTI
jgi:hypothetical protein